MSSRSSPRDTSYHHHHGGGGGGSPRQPHHTSSSSSSSSDNNSLSAPAEQPIVQVIGGALEVGRSCIIVSYRGRRIMLDCGSHPGKIEAPTKGGFKSGAGGAGDQTLITATATSATAPGSAEGVGGDEPSGHWPRFDLIDPDKIDLVLITHFHVDHCAALPVFTEKLSAGNKEAAFKGRIFATHATKAVMKLSLVDTIRLQPHLNHYTEKELQNCMNKVETIDFYQTVSHMGIKITPVKAGHVLGACMFYIEIEGFCFLYTGDYSTEVDLHLPSADVGYINSLCRDKPPDLLICESTHGVEDLESRIDRENKLDKALEEIISRGGNVLMPVFALGRAQELMLLIERLWRDNPKFNKVKVYFKSEMGNKAMKCYKTFPYSMNDNIQNAMDFKNPFDFEYITDMPDIQDLQTPCVVLANPGFMDNGKSRELFELWCDDRKNGVLICGYAIEGTLAYKLEHDMKTPKIFKNSKEENQDALSASNVSNEFTGMDLRKRKVNCSVDCISFSAHVGFSENLSFMTSVRPKSVMLVHGKKKNIHNIEKRLKASTYWVVDDGSDRAKATAALLEEEVVKAQRLAHRHGATFIANGRVDARLRPTIYSPDIGEKVRIELLDGRFAAMGLGSLAADALTMTFDDSSSSSSSSSSSNSNSDSNNNNNSGGSLSLAGNNAVLVRDNFESKVMRKEDLALHTRIKAGFIRQRIVLPVPPELIQLYSSLEGAYSYSSNSSSSSVGGGVKVFLLRYVLDVVQEVFEDANLLQQSSSSSSSDKEVEIVVQDSVRITADVDGGISSVSTASTTTAAASTSNPNPNPSSISGGGNVEGCRYLYFISWKANPIVDTIADSVIALVTHRLETLSIVQYQHLCVKRQLNSIIEDKSFNKRLFLKNETSSSSSSSSRAAGGVLGVARGGESGVRNLFQYARDEDDDDDEEDELANEGASKRIKK